MTSWVRLWHDMPTDPKWRTIARKSGQRITDVMAVFTFALVNASANESDRGTLAGFNPEDVGTALDLDAEAVAAILTAMQGKVLDGDRLTGWKRRQPQREDVTAGARKAAWKERQKHKGNDAERIGTHWNSQERPDTDTDTEVEARGARVAGASPAAKPGSKGEYAFQGNIVRLTRADLERWEKTYHAIPDIRAELASLDAWLTDQPEAKQSKWFHTVSGCLNRKHQDNIASRASTATGSVDPMPGIVLARKRLREAAAREKPREPPRQFSTDTPTPNLVEADNAP